MSPNSNFSLGGRRDMNRTAPNRADDSTFLTTVDVGPSPGDADTDKVCLDQLVERIQKAKKNSVRHLKVNAESLLSVYLPLFNDDGTIAAVPFKREHPGDAGTREVEVVYDPEKTDPEVLNSFLPLKIPAVELYYYLTTHEKGAFLNHLSDFNLTQFLAKPVAGHMIVSFFWYVVVRCRRGWLEKILIGRYIRLQHTFDALYSKSERSSEATLPRLQDLETLTEELLVSDFLWQKEKAAHDSLQGSVRSGASSPGPTGSRGAEAERLIRFLDSYDFQLVKEMPGFHRTGRLPDCDNIDLLSETLNNFVATLDEYNDHVAMEQKCFGRLAALFGSYFLYLEGEKDLLIRNCITVITRTVYFALQYCFPNDSHAKMFNATFRANMVQLLSFWCSGWLMNHVPTSGWLTPTSADTQRIETIALKYESCLTYGDNPIPLLKSSAENFQSSTEDDDAEEDAAKDGQAAVTQQSSQDFDPNEKRKKRVKKSKIAPLQESSFDDVDVSDANGGYRLISEFHRHTEHAENLVCELEKRVNRQHRRNKVKQEVVVRRNENNLQASKRVPRGNNYFDDDVEETKLVRAASSLSDSTFSSYSEKEPSELPLPHPPLEASVHSEKLSRSVLSKGADASVDRRDTYMEKVRKQLMTSQTAESHNQLAAAVGDVDMKSELSQEPEDSFLTQEPLALCDATVRAYLLDRAGTCYSDVPFPIASASTEIMAELREKYRRKLAQDALRKKSFRRSFRRTASANSAHSTTNDGRVASFVLTKTSKKVFCSPLDVKPHEVSRSLAERQSQRAKGSKVHQEKAPVPEASPFIEYYAANFLKVNIGKNAEKMSLNDTFGSGKRSSVSHSGGTPVNTQKSAATLTYITKDIQARHALPLNSIRKEALTQQERIGKEMHQIEKRDQLSRHVYISKHIESVTEENRVQSEGMKRQFRQMARRQYDLRDKAEKNRLLEAKQSVKDSDKYTISAEPSYEDFV
ncbi:hypothetical protein AGDE_12580 [Angomonas deanei]|nr:hypothetical protein AGDE_12580 [Angomonas deanei]|eukprot:EPY24145.1 hypothetical protein AGDE_12580 [Angomonas deanei]